MAKASEIPYLLSLLDDESVEVQQHISKALMDFGESLETQTLSFLNQLDFPKRTRLEAIYRTLRNERFGQNWPNWMDTPGYCESLEQAFSDLAQLDYGSSRRSLSELLDDLAEQFSAQGSTTSYQALMHFLFSIKQFGAPKEGYYEPLNSNLIYVLESKQGIQISLSAIAILLGARLGIPLRGLSIPGHFMLMARDHDTDVILDPFQKGRSISASTLNYLKHALKVEHLEDILVLKASPIDIIMRVLRNLINAYDRASNAEQVNFYKVAVDQVNQHLNQDSSTY